jgi:hypothetical protein
VATVVVFEDLGVARRALETELVRALSASHVVTATFLLDRDFALGARGRSGRDDGFGLLVVKVAEVLASLAHVLTVQNFFGGRSEFGGRTSVDGTVLVTVRVCPSTKAVPAELVEASCAFDDRC